MSRIDLAPAQTTATRVRASSTRSAEMSNVSSAPRWTPPMPPVAKTSSPGERGDEHRRRDRGARRTLARRDRREIPPRGLDDAAGKLAEPLDFLPVEADAETSVDDRDRRRNGPHLARRLLDGTRRLDVARIGHAVGDDRRFERDDRLLGRERLGDLGGKIQEIDGAHRSTLSSRAAAIGRRRDYRQSPLRINGAAQRLDRAGQVIVGERNSIGSPN